MIFSSKTKPQSVFVKASKGSVVTIEDCYTEADTLVENDGTSIVTLTDVQHHRSISTKGVVK